MYGEAQKVLGKGLSVFPRLLLGLISGLFGIVLIYLELLTHQSTNPLAIYSFGLFCISISLACFTRGLVRQIIGRVIGGSVFLVSAWYLYIGLTNGVFISGSRSEPSVLNAALFFLAFGLPGIWYALFASFPIKIGNMDEESFHYAYKKFINAVTLLSQSFDKRNKLMEHYHNTVLDLIHDIIIGAHLLDSPHPILSEEQKNAIHQFLTRLDEIPESIINTTIKNDEISNVMNHPCWDSLRPQANNLLITLNPITKQNEEYVNLKSGKKT